MVIDRLGGQFHGQHNRSKYRALFALMVRDNQSPGQWYSSSEIARISGVDYHYLRNRLPKWHEWGYLKCSSVTRLGRPIRVYSISQHGKDYIGSAPMGFAQSVINEIRDWQLMASARSV